MNERYDLNGGEGSEIWGSWEGGRDKLHLATYFASAKIALNDSAVITLTLGKGIEFRTSK